MLGKSLPELAFLASLAIAVGGTCVALGGLASMQAYCNENGSIFPGVQKEYLTAAQLTYKGIDCAKMWRFEWFGWALQVFFLIVVCVCWATTNVHNYKSALWALAATVIAPTMTWANHLIDMYEKTQGDLRTRGVVTFLGYCAFCAGDYLMMFTGNHLYRIKHSEIKRRQELAENANSSKLEGVTMA